MSLLMNCLNATVYDVSDVLKNWLLLESVRILPLPGDFSALSNYICFPFMLKKWTACLQCTAQLEVTQSKGARNTLIFFLVKMKYFIQQ